MCASLGVIAVTVLAPRCLKKVCSLLSVSTTKAKSLVHCRTYLWCAANSAQTADEHLALQVGCCHMLMQLLTPLTAHCRACRLL